MLKKLEISTKPGLGALIYRVPVLRSAYGKWPSYWYLVFATVLHALVYVFVAWLILNKGALLW